jgi:alkyl sulfatase BDS1-like metallo-beta-lactamase superfamily hydrolase
MNIVTKITAVLMLAFPLAGQATQQAAHFDPLGKPPSKYTIEVLDEARKTLPFSDTRDFDENRKGLIAPMKERQIKADAGHVAWDMDQFNFIDEQDRFDSVHPVACTASPS